MSTSGEIFAQHPSVLNRYFKGSAAREAEKATLLPPVGGPPLSIFVFFCCCFLFFGDDSVFFVCQKHLIFENNVLVLFF